MARSAAAGVGNPMGGNYPGSPGGVSDRGRGISDPGRGPDSRKNKKKIRVLANIFESPIVGAQHIREGDTPLFYHYTGEKGETTRKDRAHNRNINKQVEIRRERERLREELPEIVDPTVERAKNRRQALRDRMRGFLGTLLSQRV